MPWGSRPTFCGCPRITTTGDPGFYIQHTRECDDRALRGRIGVVPMIKRPMTDDVSDEAIRLLKMVNRRPESPMKASFQHADSCKCQQCVAYMAAKRFLEKNIPRLAKRVAEKVGRWRISEIQRAAHLGYTDALKIEEQLLDEGFLLKHGDGSVALAEPR